MRLVKNKKELEAWTTILGPKRGLFEINFKDLWNYKDLILLFVRRDFVAYYKQTILGPLWFVIQPLFTTLIFTLVFGTIANIETAGVPHQLFYLSGIVCWSYFAECFNKTSNTFITNANIFGKVYFPRLAVPISIVISNLITFAIQFLLFICFLIYFMIAKGYEIKINSSTVYMLPMVVLQIAILGLGMGMIISSLTTRYKDLTFAIPFLVQLWMYATPIVYPLSLVPERIKFFFLFNPMVSVVETFRKSFLGLNQITSMEYLSGWGTTMIILCIGLLLFNKIEKNFMDTI